MNYPIWQVPAGGLFIAAVAVLHVFISHFAVGGGLFLVVSEHRARRNQDQRLLAFLKSYSRFFILLTLVLGALTGVGIWFTIGLIQPQATSSLINTFVWVWAIEWTFFVTEIAAAIAYYYGWERLGARHHLTVGWMYVGAGWLSLFAINGILSFMLTPGEWITTRRVWDGFFNPTFWPSLVARTAVAAGLAGLYSLLIAAWSGDPTLKRAIAGFAVPYWVVPTALLLPASLVWYLSAAGSAGIPVSEILGAANPSVGALIGAVLSAPAGAGQPVVQRAALITLAAAAVVLLVSLLVLARRATFGKPLAVIGMVAGFAAMGGGEWTREGLRKPYVIDRLMFVNGVRLPAPEAAAGTGDARPDPFSVTALNRAGILATSPWVRLSEDETLDPTSLESLQPEARTRRLDQAGHEVFRLLCSTCHTLDGYLAIHPLVRGMSADGIDGTLQRLAVPVDARGNETSWDDPALHLRTWRERRMPPFVGTAIERRALATYLARLGGGTVAGVEPAGAGAAFFEANCSPCHADEASWPMRERVRGRTAAAFYELIGRLPEVNPIMPAFEGTDEERRAVAAYLAQLGQASVPSGVRP